MDIKPQLAQLAQGVPSKPGLVIEPKLDGTRILVHVAEDGVHFYTRRGEDHIGKLPQLTKELSELPVDTWLDGELVSLSQKDGKIVCEWGTVTSVLGSKLPHIHADTLTYVAFDIMKMDGHDVRTLPLSDRRSLLERLLAKFEWDRVTIIPQVEASEKAHQVMLDLGYEGSMVKDPNARYASGKRGYGWDKIKPTVEVEGVIIGFKPGEGSFTGLVGALIFGQFQDGKMVERGKCSGMDFATRQHISQNPDEYLGRVITVKHEGTTKHGNLRFPRFMRFRDDREATEITFHNE